MLKISKVIGRIMPRKKIPAKSQEIHPRYISVTKDEAVFDHPTHGIVVNRFKSLSALPEKIRNL